MDGKSKGWNNEARGAVSLGSGMTRCGGNNKARQEQQGWGMDGESKGGGMMRPGE